MRPPQKFCRQNRIPSHVPRYTAFPVPHATRLQASSSKRELPDQTTPVKALVEPHSTTVAEAWNERGPDPEKELGFRNNIIPNKKNSAARDIDPARSSFN